jgi:Ca-activated chloride channel family protein
MGDGSFKKDLSGNVVTTKLNEQIGKSIAQAGGGMYVHVDQTNLAQSLLEKEIEKMQKEDISQSMYSEYDEQFVAVALLLFIVLVVELCVMERKNRWLGKFKLFS